MTTINQPPPHASEPDDPGLAEFWELRYRDGDTGWDIGQPAPPFVGLLAEADAPPPGSMIVLGCGRGHDAVFFAHHGFDVTAVDFAPSAIRAAEREAERGGVKIRFVEHDLFTLDEGYNHRFDYVLEHTCFSALPPARRSEYAQLVRRLLTENGTYFALFFTHGRPGGPPFDTTAEEVRALFSPYFSITRLEQPGHSAEQRAGLELLAIMQPLSRSGTQ